MKRCTVTHQAPTFGTIPAGSLWDDDSPYVDDAPELFVDADHPDLSDDVEDDA